MKKFTIITLAVLLAVAFTLPAWATEHEFSGNWRNRFYTKKRYDGTADRNVREWSGVDQRIQIQYSAIVNDNLKVVTKYEIDAIWGQADAAPGTDAVDIEVARVYVDFNLTPNLNIKTGYQMFYLARGYLVSDDAAGIIATYKVNPGLAFIFAWCSIASHASNMVSTLGVVNPGALVLDVDNDATINDADVDLYALVAVVALSKNIVLKPMYAFVHSQTGVLYADGLSAFPLNATLAVANIDNINIHILGLDADFNFGNFSAYFTGMWNFGDITVTRSGRAAINALEVLFHQDPQRMESDDVDMAGWMIVMGAKYNFGMFDIHAKFLYATGDDARGLADNEYNSIYTTPINFSYWAQIMGRGTFDGSTGQGGTYVQGVSLNSPAHDNTNLWYIQLGTTVKPMDKMTVGLDVYYAELAEERTWFDEDGDWHRAGVLGLEVDLRVTYQIIEGLNLDLVAAYLFRDDATYQQTSRNRDDWTANNTANAVYQDSWEEADPWMLGARLSLAF